MSTAEQFGFIKPVGTDLISLGDNAISTNADVTALQLTRAIEGTGPRNITTLFEGGTSAGTVMLYRIGGIVYLSVYNYGYQGSTSFYTLPVGFRPPTDVLVSQPFFGLSGNNQDPGERVIIGAESTGTLRPFNLAAQTSIYGSFDWPTREPWPTTLPGTAM